MSLDDYTDLKAYYAGCTFPDREHEGEDEQDDMSISTTELVAREVDQPARRSDAEGLALVVERLAANPDVDVIKLEKIIELQERILKHQAKAAFDDAFAALQGELPTVVERGKTNNGRYATLEDIIETVRPILKRYAFSLSHRTEWPEVGCVKIVGILAHRAGHEKHSEFLSAADKSGNKNDIQALGSALSYGRRYTTLDLLNIVTRGEDDDGARSGQKVEAPAGFDDWFDDMAAVADEGTARLETEWRKAKPEYRKFVAKWRADGWAGLKAKAAKVKAVRS